MIVVTGGAGFIGSALVWKLNEEGIDDILIVDNLGTSEKWKNLTKRRFNDYLHKENFLEMVLADKVPVDVDVLIHLGACSSTTERDAEYLMRNNYLYSRALAVWAMRKEVRFIYASSAATYGDGSQGFPDDDAATLTLRPITMYGYSKQLFDVGILKNGLAKKVAGIKFFNVFGPNEYHKGEMRSVIHKAFNQIRETGKVRLFKSYKPEYPDGGQVRDFLYVKDCVEVLWWFYRNPGAAGIYNLGTGKARTWNDLVKAVFSAMDKETKIDYIEMPGGIRDQYQYFTEARMEKLRAAGCPVPFQTLEEAVRDYVVSHLQQKDPYL
jgi:ADP-L-glycero-D-manno-heptose 6-epimerase